MKQLYSTIRIDGLNIRGYPLTTSVCKVWMLTQSAMFSSLRHNSSLSLSTMRSQNQSVLVGGYFWHWPYLCFAAERVRWTTKLHGC